MKIACSLAIPVLLLLVFPPQCHGLGTEQFGPDPTDRPSAEQPGWPKGIVELARHRSRVHPSDLHAELGTDTAPSGFDLKVSLYESDTRARAGVNMAVLPVDVDRWNATPDELRKGIIQLPRQAETRLGASDQARFYFFRTREAGNGVTSDTKRRLASASSDDRQLSRESMPHRTFGLDDVARYLHLGRADVEHLMKNQEIPFEKNGNRFLFRKVEIDSWASRRILGLEGKHLRDYHQKTSRAAQEISHDEALLPHRLQPDFIDPALPAKTKPSVLREMTLLAGKTGRVNDQAFLLEELRAREDLCSTGVPGGLALLHPRHPDPLLIDSPFIVLSRTVQRIPFGAPDGRPTDLFFLIGCPDDRLHLHLLARLCLMAQKTQILDELREASSSQAMYYALINSELAVLEGQAGASR